MIGSSNAFYFYILIFFNMCYTYSIRSDKKMKKILTLLLFTTIFTMFIGINVFAEGEVATETKTWGDTILEYVPAIVQSIAALGMTIFAWKLSSKKITISLDDLGNAKNNFNTVGNAVKELTEKLATYNEEFAKYNEAVKKILEEQIKIKKALKTIATTNKELVEEGASIEIVKELEGDE